MQQLQHIETEPTETEYKTMATLLHHQQRKRINGNMSTLLATSPATKAQRWQHLYMST